MCFARDVSVHWTPNSEADLEGYKIHYKVGLADAPFAGVGAAEGASPIDVHTATAVTLTGLDPALNYSLAATAYNTAGIESLLSDVVVIYDIIPPVVSIISPKNNGTTTGNTVVSVSAVDAGGIARVEFYVDSVLHDTLRTAPFDFTLRPTEIQEKSYSVFAVAYDIAGNMTQSSDIRLNVTGYSTLNDALLSLRYVLGLETLTMELFTRLDVAPLDMITRQSSPDGRVDIDDVIVILRRSVGQLTW
ncbi:MAG: Ig-like domain-containing protein [Desulfuromonadaceae bacterium]|nr:Ig-like domain-containing protein [Desulfuromonadaceae bacterium]